MYNVRSRLVNFRVTNEEFERLKAASDTRGARCLSEFARGVILGTIEDGPPADPSVHQELRTFSRRLATVEANLARLIDALAAVKGVSLDIQS